MSREIKRAARLTRSPWNFCKKENLFGFNGEFDGLVRFHFEPDNQVLSRRCLLVTDAAIFALLDRFTIHFQLNTGLVPILDNNSRIDDPRGGIPIFVIGIFVGVCIGSAAT
jgi:hypothetical protein